MTPRAGRSVLGLSDSSAIDSADVRQAYADRLRAMDPDADPAGFARLRDARDTVLADLRRRESGATADLPDPFADSDEDTTEPTPAVPWLYAAPVVERLQLPGTVAAQALPASDAPLIRFAGGRAQAPADAPLHIATWPFGIPRLDHADTGDVIADAGRWSVLQALLTPGSAGQPMDDAETARALGHMRAVLRIIDALPIEQSAGAEDSVAGLLAQAWPRSAPLLEPAAAAFGWESERGQLSERPAIAFLNARLRGLRFVEKVEQSGHPLHRAWAELSKPGFKRGWWVRKADVKSLLEGVRKNFPELEQHLDAQRVGAWEQTIYPGSNVPRGFVGAFSGNRLGWVIVLIGIRLAAVLAWSSPSTTPLPIRPPMTQASPDAAAMVLDQASAHWFGPGTSFADVGRRAPTIGGMAAANAGGTFDPASADHAMRDAVFAGLHKSVVNGDHDTLRAVQRLRLQVVDAARRVDAATCYDFLFRNAVEDRVVLTPEQEASARKLVGKIGATGLFEGNSATNAMTAQVPGDVIDRIATTTHLPTKQVIGVLRHEGLNSVQCAVRRELIAEALRLPRATGDPILRVN